MYEADLYQVTLNDKNYQLSVYLDEHHIFLELEENKNEAIDFSKLHAFHADLNTSENIWQSLCNKFYDILKFDRIMIYQFLEDNTGKVIPESIHGELTSVLNFRYPEFDIPAQARALYLKNLSRQIPDVLVKTYNL